MISTTILVISYGSLEKWIGGNFNCQQNVSTEGLKLFPCLRVAISKYSQRCYVTTLLCQAPHISPTNKPSPLESVQHQP